MSANEFSDSNAASGFGAAATIVEVLKQCGDDLSRDSIMRHAADLRNFHAPLLLPGITINTSSTNFSPIRQLQLSTFNGESWEPFGDLVSD
jgi:branched-chain amino acid transport system substrate-binding protein